MGEVHLSIDSVWHFQNHNKSLHKLGLEIYNHRVRKIFKVRKHLDKRKISQQSEYRKIVGKLGLKISRHTGFGNLQSE